MKDRAEQGMWCECEPSVQRKVRVERRIAGSTRSGNPRHAWDDACAACGGMVKVLERQEVR